jgi:hypothetical protein
MKSPRLIATLVALAATVGTLALASPADAATKIGNFSVAYNKTWTFKSRPLGVCLIMNASGNASYTLSAQGEPRGGIFLWTNQKVNKPRLAASIHAYSGGSCIGPALTTKLTMGQHWAGSSCGFNPSVSVSFPWGISFSGWPSCGSRDQAVYATTYAVRTTSYVQNNSGSPVSYPTHTSPTESGYPCIGVFVSAVAYENASSDSFGAGDGASSQSVCLSKN